MTAPVGRCAGAEDAGVEDAPKRINVAVSRPMLDAIDRVIAQEDVTLTEAVRRLIGYGDFVHVVTRDPASRLVVRGRNDQEREVRAT